jgi:predicted RNase H-like HicB family nuclease
MNNLEEIIEIADKQAVKDIIDKVVAFGKVIISTDDNEIETPILFVIEDDVYVYAYCQEFGIFAYGNDIDSARDSLASAISINIIKLSEENRLLDIYSNPLDIEYEYVYKYFLRRKYKTLLVPVFERILHPENTKVVPAVKKGPQLYVVASQQVFTIA